MSRGGKRKGAGRPTKWREGTTKEDTKTVRIPKRIVNEVLDYAYKLDNCVTQSKNIDKVSLVKLKEAVLKSLEMGKQAKKYKQVENTLNIQIDKIINNSHD